MAEVFGNIGGQPVELNNAATEATLKQLVKAIGILSAKSGGGSGGKNLDKDLKKFYDQLNKTTSAQKKAAKVQEDENTAREANNKALKEEERIRERSAYITEKAVGGVNRFADATVATAGKLTGVMNEIANMGSSMTAAAAVFGNIPIAGGILSTVFGAIAGQSEKLLKSFQQSASVGANFGGSISEMVNAASGAGLTVDQFTSIIAKNGEYVSLLGKGSADGAKQLANYGKAMKDSGSADELYRLGYSAEEVNNGMAGYAGRLAKTGQLQGLTAQQVAASTASYLKELDAVARLTGQSKESLQKQEEERMRDAQYMQFKRKLDKDSQIELEALLATIPEGMREGAKEVIATGTATSEAGENFLAYMNKTGQDLTTLGINARNTGKIQKGSAEKLSATMQGEAKDLANSGLGDTAAAFIPGMNKFMGGVYEASAREATLNETKAQQQKEAEARLKKDQELKDKGLDPAAMVGFQQKIAELSNQFSMLLAQHLPMLMNAFNALIPIINNFLVPAFTFFMDHIKLIVGAFVALKVAMMAYQGYLKVKELKDGLKGTKANPMIVQDVAGGGLGGGADGPDDKKGDKKKGGKGKLGQLSKIGSVAKIGGIVGAVAGVANMASDISDINDDVKEGKITQGEATEKKGGAVGSAVGGAGGAWAGAAAGAAIGSVVPVVGTVIGGLIGGALGGWLGSKGGDVIGKAAGKAVATPDGKKPTAGTPGTPGGPATPAPAAAVAAAPAVSKNYNDQASLLQSELMQQRGKEINTKLKEIETQKAEEKKKADEEKLAKEKELKEQASKPTPAQEKQNKELERLNTTMAELVKINKIQQNLGEEQLEVQKGFGGDLFMSA